MNNYLFFCFFCFLVFLNAEKAYSKQISILNIGLVKIIQKENQIEIQHGNFSRLFEKPDSIMWATFIVTTPFIEYGGADGVIREEESQGLKSFDWERKLSSEDFVLFPFFSKDNTTIAFLETSAGGSGGSSQSLLFLDTKTLKNVEINNTDMYGIRWKNPHTFPLCPILPTKQDTGKGGSPISFHVESNDKNYCP